MWKFIEKLFGTKESEEYKEDPMKYLIVGLGNVGSKYEDTRHNIGFDVVDEMAKSKEVQFKNDTLADVCTIKNKGRTLILVKPTTFMNLSGKAVRYWMTKHKIQPENLLVIVDDLHLDFGAIRLRTKGKDAGHNGLKNIQDILNTSQYPRLKMGIGSNFRKGDQVNYVLGKWTDKEAADLGAIIASGIKAVYDFTTIGAARAMSANNTK